MLRNLPAQQQQDQLAAEANGEGQGEAAEAEAQDNNTTAARTTKLVLLKENTDALGTIHILRKHFCKAKLL